MQNWNRHLYCVRAYDNCYCIMLSQTKMVVAHTTVSKNSLCHSSTYSRLSLNRHLYKMVTSVKRTLRVGPCLSLLLYLTLYKTDISLRQTLAGPKGVRLRES